METGCVKDWTGKRIFFSSNRCSRFVWCPVAAPKIWLEIIGLWRTLNKRSKILRRPRKIIKFVHRPPRFSIKRYFGHVVFYGQKNNCDSWKCKIIWKQNYTFFFFLQPWDDDQPSSIFQVICSKIEVPPDYGGGEGSPGSPEMHHCSSTTQPLGTSEVCENIYSKYYYFFPIDSKFNEILLFRKVSKRKTWYLEGFA